MPTAQEAYNEMLKTAIAPGLRAIGFKGSGQNDRLPSDHYWAMLDFQKSTSSDAGRVRFIVKRARRLPIQVGRARSGALSSGRKRTGDLLTGGGRPGGRSRPASIQAGWRTRCGRFGTTFSLRCIAR